MKELNKETKKRFEWLRDLYSAACVAAEETYDRLTKNMEQYLGSDEIDGSTERASVVRNITYELIESEINADIPTPKVDTAFYSEKREQNARAVERLASALRSRIPFEELNDRDERYTYVMGGSIFYVEWDSTKQDSAGDGEIRVHLLSPMDFIPQPGIDEVEDMEYCFLHFTTTRSELMTKYGVSESDAAEAECEFLADIDDPSGDAVAVVVAFYRDKNGEVGKMVFSGQLMLNDTPSYYRRKKFVCTECGRESSECDCALPTKKSLDLEYENITLPDGKKVRIPYYVPDCFPIVVRKNTVTDLTFLGGSDCEKIRHQQQAINKVESRILQKLLRAGITPVMPEGTAVTLNNSVFGQVIKTRPGESMASYGTIDTTPDIAQDIKEADRLYDQAKRVLGISDALQGLDSTTSESGYARQLKISRASSRLETKKRMKHLAYCRIYEMIFKHYLAFADESRSFAYRDTMGKIHFSEFNRYDFVEMDKYGNYYYDDSYLFTVDANADDQYSTESLWEINLNNLERGTLGDKASPATLMRYWQLQDKAHYPYARENVEYFRNMINRETDAVGDALSNNS